MTSVDINYLKKVTQEVVLVDLIVNAVEQASRKKTLFPHGKSDASTKRR